LTDDLNILLGHLALRNILLLGFSMGTGEVTRYLGRYGPGRVARAAMLGAIPPFVLKTGDNPEGVDGQVFEATKAAIVADRYAFFEYLLNNLYNVDTLGPARISERAWQASFIVAAGASAYATYACVDSWLTDFRADLSRIDVPILVMHGTEDRIMPVEATASRLPGLVKDLKLITIEGGRTTWAGPTLKKSTPLYWTSSDADRRRLAAGRSGDDSTLQRSTERINSIS
jgi:non-heme chloroperoxidase